ncbi:MAG: aspartate-semialdehyde dehydrogenase, partial [Candidatus Eremiobacteraeota bacterium]|nr:aspartate-semialdehyde dehydrogenase [Candidatus Eremiobacteraeota bacterium]
MKVAVVGATGIVGETLLRVLAERELPIEELGAFASEARSHAVRFAGQSLEVRVPSAEALRPFDAVFFASTDEISAKFVPGLLARGAVVIDNSSAFRMKPGVPLIVPEVNRTFSSTHRLFPVGNCTAIILCVSLA